jgi:hypothetical protein
LSVYDSKDLMEFGAAAREYGIPLLMIQKAVEHGTLRAIPAGESGSKKLLRFDVENFVKRIVKRGYGNRIASRINPAS